MSAYDLQWRTERDDLREALTWRFWHTPRLRIVAVVFCLCGVVGVIEAVLAAAGRAHGSVPSIVVLLVFPVLLVLLPWLQATSMLRNNPALREPTGMEFSAEGITVRRRTAHSRITWPDFCEVQETRRCFLLRYTGMKIDLLIPKRALPGDAAAFRRFLDEHVQAAAGQVDG